MSAVLVTVATLNPLQLRLSASAVSAAKFDALLQPRAALSSGSSRVIVRATHPGSLGIVNAAIAAAGGRLRRPLPGNSSQVAVVPNAALSALAVNPHIASLSLDRPIVASMERTSATVGSAAVRQQLGYDGNGIGVAVIDSGVARSLDDLTDGSGAQRVVQFGDFVNGSPEAYDDYGHGTHVAGIIAGNGFDSSGARTGIAPGASLIVLKVLDGTGSGYVSDVIAAIDYAIAHRDALKIRIINLSMASGVYESFETDPLTLAAERAVKAGIVVVAAAGNHGASPEGHTRYRGITAPGNAPWVLTVGASSHMGTIARSDDTVAAFSSRGPTAIDQVAKPDVLAPGVGIESLSSPNSRLTITHPDLLLPGTIATSYLPYMSLSGTSMSAPVVAGTVALMLQANPELTPNEVKAILQYTAETSPYSDPLTQGAGYLNAKGAVELARFLKNPGTTAYPDSSSWSAGVIWGNYLITGGRLEATANAWSLGVRWGAQVTSSGKSVEWGVLCNNTACDSNNRWSWAKAVQRNVVWGDICSGTDCTATWTLHLVSGADDGDTVVWGTTDDGDTVVWGTIDEGDTVVWGTIDEGDTVVWGTRCTDENCPPIVWPR